MKNWIPFLLFLLTLSSCKTRNVAQSDTTDHTRDSINTTKDNGDPKDVNEPVSDKFTFYEHVLIPPKFEQIKIDSKIKVETGSYVPTLDATIYIENDKRYG